MDRKLITRKKEGERKAGHARITRSCGRGMLALLLCICLLGMNLPVTAFADETQSGGGIAAPTFSAALTDGELTITLSGAEGADIYYTTDGTEPTASSTKYDAPFAVTDNTKATTIKAFVVSGSTTGAVMTVRCGYAGAGGTNQYGKNIIWTLDGAGTLVASGNGDMTPPNRLWSTWNTDIKKVQIQQGITKIGYMAFYKCQNLQEVTLAGSITGIGEWAFNSCTALTSIVLPSGLERIESNAFSNSGLVSLYIPASVKNIGKSIATNNVTMTSLSVAPENQWYYSERNCIIEKTSKNLVMGCQTSVIPCDVTFIDDYAFNNVGISEVALPDSVTSIGEYAFGKAKFHTLVVPDSVTEIGERAFFKCENLTKIVIPDSVTTIEGTYDADTSKDTGIFNSCSGSLEIYCVADSGVATLLKNAGYGEKLRPAYAVQLDQSYEGGYSLQKAAGTTTLTPFPNDPVSFTITADKGYTRNVTVKVNGQTLTPVDGVYTIAAVTADTCKVTLEGTGLCTHENAAFTADDTLHQLAESCPDCGKDDFGTFTLTAQDGVYDGTAKPAAVSSTVAGMAVPAIAYAAVGAGAETALTGAPTAAGTYRASITCGSATVSTTYEITKAAGLTLSVSCRYASGAAVTFDPQGYLPADCGTMSIASVSDKTGFFDDADCVSVDAGAKTVSLTLPPIVNGASTGSFALKIDTANYKTSVLTVNVTLTEQAAPEITAVSVGTPKDTSATVTATADAGAATYYLYYTTTLWQSVNVDDLTASGEGHLSNAGGTFVLSGLTPETHYYVYIAAADAAGNVGNIRVADFTTAETQQAGGHTGGSTGGSSGGGGSFGGGGAAVPDTPAAPDADTDKEPQIKGGNGATGWDAIRSEFASAKDGDTITVQMNGARTVPGKTLKSIRGKDVSVTFELTERLSLTINGADLRGITIKNKNNYSVLFLWTVTGVTHLMQSVGA